MSPIWVGDGQDADGLAFLPHMPVFFGRQSRFWRQPMLVEEVNLTALFLMCRGKVVASEKAVGWLAVLTSW